MRLPHRVRADGLGQMRSAYCRGRGRPTGTVAKSIWVCGEGPIPLSGGGMLHLEFDKCRVSLMFVFGSPLQTLHARFNCMSHGKRHNRVHNH